MNSSTLRSSIPCRRPSQGSSSTRLLVSAIGLFVVDVYEAKPFFKEICTGSIAIWIEADTERYLLNSFSWDGFLSLSLPPLSFWNFFFFDGNFLCPWAGGPFLCPRPPRFLVPRAKDFPMLRTLQKANNKVVSYTVIANYTFIWRVATSSREKKSFVCIVTKKTLS